MRKSYLIAAAMLAAACVVGAQKPATVDVPSSVSLAVGHDTTLAGVVKDMSGKPVVGARIQYASADTTIAKVNAMGAIIGVAPGSTQLTATALDRAGTPVSNVSASIAVTVTDALASKVPVRTTPRRRSD